SGIGMWLENPLVGARRALTLGRGASLRAARFAGAAADFDGFATVALPEARLPEAPLPEPALSEPALPEPAAAALAPDFDLSPAALPAPFDGLRADDFAAAPPAAAGAAPGPPSTASRRRRRARSSSTILRCAASTSVRVGMPRVAQTCSTWPCRPARTRICASTRSA